MDFAVIFHVDVLEVKFRTRISESEICDGDMVLKIFVNCMSRLLC